MDNIKKRNKNNRKRGSRFEKIIADYLDMDVVPYSGSNARFGYGDVRDSIWLCECKNISIDSKTRCKIQTSWIKDNREKANIYGLMPFLAWMPSGRSEKYIILERDEFIKLNVYHDITVQIPKASVNAVNIFIDIMSADIKQIKSGKIVQIKFGYDYYWMMDVTIFRNLILKNGMKGMRQNYDIQISRTL